MLLFIAHVAILIYSWAYFGYFAFNALETWFKILKIFFSLKFKYLMYFLENWVSRVIIDSESESELTLHLFQIWVQVLKLMNTIVWNLYDCMDTFLHPTKFLSLSLTFAEDFSCCNLSLSLSMNNDTFPTWENPSFNTSYLRSSWSQDFFVFKISLFPSLENNPFLKSKSTLDLRIPLWFLMPLLRSPFITLQWPKPWTNTIGRKPWAPRSKDQRLRLNLLLTQLKSLLVIII